MKVVDTQFRSEEALPWEEIVDLITSGIYEEDFIVLLDKKQTNYIQMAEDENGFVIESREYQGDEFTHYRTYVDEPEQAVPFFEKYYNDEKIDFSTWNDVTSEFLD